MVIYSKEQIRTLLQAAYEYHSIYLEILLALFAGLRKDEIAGLRYSDFDSEKENMQLFPNLGMIVPKWKEYISIGLKGNIKGESTGNAALERICARNSLTRISMHDRNPPERKREQFKSNFSMHGALLRRMYTLTFLKNRCSHAKKR